MRNELSWKSLEKLLYTESKTKANSKKLDDDIDEQVLELEEELFPLLPENFEEND